MHMFTEEAKYLVKQKTDESLRNKSQKRKAQKIVCPRNKSVKTEFEEEHSGQKREATKFNDDDDDDKCQDKGSVCTKLDVLTDF